MPNFLYTCKLVKGIVRPAAGIEAAKHARVPEPGPRGAEATLGAHASPLGQPSGNRGLALKARSRPT